MGSILKLALAYGIARLREPSTWRGLIMLLAAKGVFLNPEQMQAIVALALAAVGAIGVLLPDNLRVGLPKTYAEFPNDEKPPVAKGPAKTNLNRKPDGAA